MPDVFVTPNKKPTDDTSKPDSQPPQNSPENTDLNQPAPENPKTQESDIKHQSLGLFSAYLTHPRGISFANQEPDEHIIIFLRRHFITNGLWIAYSIALLFIPPLLALALNIFDQPLFVIKPQVIFVMTVFYYILVFNYAFVRFITWFYHVGIVTQKRLLDLDIDNILHYHLSETNIEDIVDVSHSQKGLFQGHFNYGDIPIQTEAIKANFEFEKAPQPATIADMITDLRRKMKGKTPNA